MQHEDGKCEIEYLATLPYLPYIKIHDNTQKLYVFAKY